MVVNPVVRFVIQGPDLGALRAFYARAFGWALYDVVPGYVGIEAYPHEHDEHGHDITAPVVFEASAGSLTWRYEGEQHRPRHFAPGPEGGLSQGAPMVMICVEVTDLTRALEQVRAAGGAVVRPPREITDFTSVAQVADPAGNVIELQQQLPVD